MPPSLIYLIFLHPSENRSRSFGVWASAALGPGWVWLRLFLTSTKFDFGWVRFRLCLLDGFDRVWFRLHLTPTMFDFDFGCIWLRLSIVMTEFGFGCTGLWLCWLRLSLTSAYLASDDRTVTISCQTSAHQLRIGVLRLDSRLWQTLIISPCCYLKKHPLIWFGTDIDINNHVFDLCPCGPDHGHPYRNFSQHRQCV